ncbi:MAG: response regulator [Gammaproteobacteria bacterium]
MWVGRFRRLEPLGFEVTEAVDGSEGLNKALANKPDIILMDLVMPVMDGFESISKIRQTPEGKEICIIALSASVFEIDRKSAIKAGASDFVPKPVRIQKLADVLTKHLNITWVYKSEDDSSSDRHHKPEAIESPSSDELQVLFQFAKQGNIGGVRAEIERLEKLNSRFIPFINNIRKLAKSFSMKQICIFLEPYLQESK